MSDKMNTVKLEIDASEAERIIDEAVSSLGKQLRDAQENISFPKINEMREHLTKMYDMHLSIDRKTLAEIVDLLVDTDKLIERLIGRIGLLEWQLDTRK